MTNRYQRTLLCNEIDKLTKSTWDKFKHSVPRGLVLGPLLFRIYIKELPTFLRGTSVPFIFADGINILLSHSDPTDLNKNINVAFKILSDWFKQNIFF
jgi:hypothetical protein